MGRLQSRHHPPNAASDSDVSGLRPRSRLSRLPNSSILPGAEQICSLGCPGTAIASLPKAALQLCFVARAIECVSEPKNYGQWSCRMCAIGS